MTTRSPPPAHLGCEQHPFIFSSRQGLLIIIIIIIIIIIDNAPMHRMLPVAVRRGPSSLLSKACARRVLPRQSIGGLLYHSASNVDDEESRAAANRLRQSLPPKRSVVVSSQTSGNARANQAPRLSVAEVNQCLHDMRPDLLKGDSKAVAHTYSLIKSCLKHEGGATLSRVHLSGLAQGWSRQSNIQAGPSLTEVLKLSEDAFEIGLFRRSYRYLSTFLLALKRLPPNEAPLAGQQLLEYYMTCLPPSNELDCDGASILICCNIVLDLWAKSERPERVDQVEALFRRIQDLHTSTNNPDLHPNQYTYIYLLTAWEHSGKRGAYDRALEISKEIKKLAITDSVLTSYLYSMVCICLTKSRARNAASEAMKVYSEMLTRYAQGEKLLEPSTKSLNAVLNALAKEGKANLVSRLIQEAETNAKDKDGNGLLDVVSYSILVHAYAKAGKPIEAEAVLRKMQSLSKTVSARMKPGALTWVSILEAWAMSDIPDRTTKAATLLEEIERTVEMTVSDRQIAYNCMLKCLANGPAIEQNEEMVDRILRSMEKQENGLPKPDGHSYSLCITAWCNAGKIDKAREMIENLAAKYKKDSSAIMPSIINCNTLLSHCSSRPSKEMFDKALSMLSWMDKMSTEGMVNLTPGTKSFSYVLKCLTGINDDDRYQALADQLYGEWKRRFGHVKPEDTNELYAYLTMISYWSQTGREDALGPIVELVSTLENTNGAGTFLETAYNHLMRYYSMTGMPELAHEVFDSMKEAGKKNKQFLPQYVSYVTLLHAWSRAGNAIKANEVLREMIEKYEAGVCKSAPGTEAFTAVVRAWAISDHADSAEKALAALSNMRKMSSSGRFNCKPDIRTYDIVQSAFYRQGTKSALEHIQLLIREQLEDYEGTGDKRISPDLLNFSHLLRLSCELGEADVLEEYLDRLPSLVNADLWQSQGEAACNSLLQSLSKSPLPEKTRYRDTMLGYMKAHGVQINR
jgi:pentatricopeptide repeat protein